MAKRRLIRWAVIVVSTYLIVTTLLSMIDLWKAADKLTSRKRALAALISRRDELLRQKNKVDSPSYLERAARDQLGLSKPGEEAVIIPEELLSLGLSEASVDATPNWQKWAKLLL